jgi:dihydroorotate dehydrogenase
MSLRAAPDLYPALRQILFQFDAEWTHHRTLGLLRLLGQSRLGRSLLRGLAGPEPTNAGVGSLGLSFANRVGLAAGYDKDAVALHGLACLGFGHLEVGTVTPEPQPGNARPRLFRLAQDQALINRLGFPSRGAAAVARALQAGRPTNVVVGVNLGKGVGTPLEAAAEDYLLLVDTFRPLADYLTVNVSSPNTLGLRRLQGREQLEALLTQLRRRLDQAPGKRPPLLVKFAPDLSLEEMEDALGACIGRVEGVIAGNTTVARPSLHSRHAAEIGGLSGRPLFPRALEQVRRIAQWSGGRLTVVGCGGVSSADDLQAMLDAGAELVQIYTAMVFQGPSVVGRILGAGQKARSPRSGASQTSTSAPTAQGS